MKNIGVKIMSKEGLEYKLANGHMDYRHCISIGSPGEKPAKGIEAFDKVLRLDFDDLVTGGNKLASTDDIVNIIDFYESTKVYANEYIIHCHAGISRSTAVGLIILYLIHGDETTAMEELLKVHSEPQPNSLVLNLFDEYKKNTNLSAVGEELHERYYRKLKEEMDNYLEELK